MFKQLLSSFVDDSVKLTVLVEDLVDKYPRFMKILNTVCSDFVGIPSEKHTVITMKMSHRNYLEFMKRIQHSDMNLKPMTDSELYYKLVDWK